MAVVNGVVSGLDFGALAQTKHSLLSICHNFPNAVPPHRFANFPESQFHRGSHNTNYLYICSACSALFYVFYFISKSLVIAEKSERVTFNDYALSLFLLFFSIIGIWLITKNKSALLT
jgi:hypothetical protein